MSWPRENKATVPKEKRELNEGDLSLTSEGGQAPGDILLRRHGVGNFRSVKKDNFFP